MSKIFIQLIRCYQVVVSPFLSSHCRFWPTCSQYGVEAICRFGILRGLLLTLIRISKCNFLHPGGEDLVPNRTKKI